MTDTTRQERGATYRFAFFRDMVNDRGDCYRCMIDTVDVPDAQSAEEALSSALRIFESRHGLASWDHLAHGYETHEVSDAACKSGN